MRTIALATAFLMSVGCGSGPGPYEPPDTVPPASVVGNWVALRSVDVGSTYTFTAAGEYAAGLLLALDANTVDAQVEKGTYRLDGNRIVFSATEATCAVSAKPRYVTYSYSGPNLSITYADSIVIFQANNSAGPPPGTQINFGCFNATTGVFAPGPFMPATP